MPLKIQYCSDLHLEFQENKQFLKKNPIQPAGEILLLAGDITLFDLIDKNKDFFDYLSDHFLYTYWIPGNHEYYHFDINNKLSPFFEKIRTNVILLNDQVIQYENIEIVLSTLWGNISPANEWMMRQNVSDFMVIKKNGKRFDPQDFNELHKTDFGFIKSALAIPTDKKRIVVTHHVPTLMNYPEQYRKSQINEAFVIELHDFIFESNAAYWLYGHHHRNIPAFKIGATQLITNQLGYIKYNEHVDFRQDAVMEF